MALSFHSDEVDEFIPFTEAVAIAENALRDLNTPSGVNAPRKRLNLHRNLVEGSFDTVLNIYAGGSAAYGAIGAQVALHRKAIAGNKQRRPPYNPDQTELALIYDTGQRIPAGPDGASAAPSWRCCRFAHTGGEFGRAGPFRQI